MGQVGALELAFDHRVGQACCGGKQRLQICRVGQSFLPRLLVMLLTLIVAGPWMVQQLMEYTQNLIMNIPQLIG